MKKEDTILIIEPDRIIGMDLQLELENNGYTVFQTQSPKLAEEFKGIQNLKVLIVDIDKLQVDEFMNMLKQFSISEFCIIAISSGPKAISEYQGVKFVETFLKPFDTKKIVAFINKNCVVEEYK